MEAAFEKLKKNQKNTVDNIVQWMKESKLIDESKEAEEKARALFADVRDKSNVEYENFKNALTKMADEQKKNVEEAFKSLTTEGPKLLSAAQEGFSNALGAGASAFKDAFAKK